MMDHRLENQAEMMMQEDLLIQEEEKIRNLQILIDDHRLTEEQKGILNDILELIRNNPITLENPGGFDPNE